MNTRETKLSVAFAAGLVAAAVLPAFAGGEPHQLQTVEATDALKIHLFNYDERSINDNGISSFFTFRNAYVDANGNAFPTHNGIDADGFGDIDMGQACMAEFGGDIVV